MTWCHLFVKITTGMVSLANDRGVARVRPEVAAVSERPACPREAVAWIHETSALVPLDADVVVEEGFVQRHGAWPGFRTRGRWSVVGPGLEVGPPASAAGGGGHGAEERGPCFFHLSCGHEGLLAPPPVGILF